MVAVSGYTKRIKRTGRIVTVRSYDRAGRVKRAQGIVFVPEEETAALYDPSKPKNPFAGRKRRGQKTPPGLRAYPYDDTKLAQKTDKTRTTLGRTKARD